MMEKQICALARADLPTSDINLFFGEIIGSLRFKNVEKQPKKSEDFQHKLPPLKALFAFLLSFVFVSWGWGWWKGLYDYPDGATGYILASLAGVVGIVLWWCGYSWSVTP
jgi:hypothetical protein